MKRMPSAVWQFFDRVIDKNTKRCISVLCKLCDTQYKFFGNTTNLRVHLTNKHPIQWDLLQNGSLDESQFIIEEDNTTDTPSTASKRRRQSKNYIGKKVRYSVSVDNEDPEGVMPKIEIQRVDVLEDSDNEEQNEDNTLNFVRQLHSSQNSDEEWLEEDPYQVTHLETYEPHKKIKVKKIKREIQSPPGLPGYYVAPKEKVMYRESNRKDEYSVFGEYVANKLRKVALPRTRSNLQQLITTLLWQAEYGLYDSADAVKRVLMYSIQSPETDPEHTVSNEYETQEVHCEVVPPNTEHNSEIELEVPIHQ